MHTEENKMQKYESVLRDMDIHVGNTQGEGRSMASHR